VGLKVSGGENKDYHSRYFKIQIYWYLTKQHQLWIQ
jgi:hypothetical protein